MTDPGAEFRELPDYVRDLLSRSAPKLHAELSRLSAVAEQAARENVACAIGSCGTAGHLPGYDPFFEQETGENLHGKPRAAVARLDAPTGPPACGEHSTGRTTYPLWEERS